MGIRNRIRNIGRGVEKEECIRNLETGGLTCRAKRINADGTEVEMRGFDVEVDASCTPIVTNDFQNDGDPSRLEEFEERKLKRVIGKCKNKPSDY